MRNPARTTSTKATFTSQQGKVLQLSDGEPSADGLCPTCGSISCSEHFTFDSVTDSVDMAVSTTEDTSLQTVISVEPGAVEHGRASASV